MSKRGQPSIGPPLGRDVRGIAMALVTGVLTTTVYIYARALLADWGQPSGHLLVTPVGQATMAFGFSTLYGVEILVICVPLWLLLRRCGWDRLPVAAALG